MNSKQRMIEMLGIGFLTIAYGYAHTLDYGWEFGREEEQCVIVHENVSYDRRCDTPADLEEPHLFIALGA